MSVANSNNVKLKEYSNEQKEESYSKQTKAKRVIANTENLQLSRSKNNFCITHIK